MTSPPPEQQGYGSEARCKSGANCPECHRNRPSALGAASRDQKTGRHLRGRASECSMWPTWTVDMKGTVIIHADVALRGRWPQMEPKSREASAGASTDGLG